MYECADVTYTATHGHVRTEQPYNKVHKIYDVKVVTQMEHTHNPVVTYRLRGL